jgi:hypothetical protein
MNLEQRGNLINRVNEMHSTPENANHQWLLGWLTPTKETHLSNKNATEAMLKTWLKFRAYCKRNDIHFQGFRIIKPNKKHGHSTIETGIFAPKESLEIISNALSQNFVNDGFQATIFKALPTSTTAQYIEKYFSKSHSQELDRLLDTTDSRPFTFINQPLPLKKSVLMMQ